MEYLDTVTLPLGDLRPYPGNARVHDLDTIEESIRQNGQYRSLVVRVEDDGKRTILAGNGTAEVLIARFGVDEVRCELIRCADDAEAARINLVDNKSNDKASYDDEALLAQLRQVDDLRGTGFVPDDTDALAKLLAAQRREDRARMDRLTSDTAPVGRLRATRVLTAEFHNETFAWVSERLADLREEWGPGSNADLIRRLLEERFKTNAPVRS